LIFTGRIIYDLINCPRIQLTFFNLLILLFFKHLSIGFKLNYESTYSLV
jgi:hypothetical protein